MDERTAACHLRPFTVLKETGGVRNRWGHVSRHVAVRAFVAVVVTVVTASLMSVPASAQGRGRPTTPQLPRRDSTDRTSSRKDEQPAVDPSSVLVRFKQG